MNNQRRKVSEGMSIRRAEKRGEAGKGERREGKG